MVYRVTATIVNDTIYQLVPPPPSGYALDNGKCIDGPQVVNSEVEDGRGGTFEAKSFTTTGISAVVVYEIQDPNIDQYLALLILEPYVGNNYVKVQFIDKTTSINKDLVWNMEHNYSIDRNASYTFTDSDQEVVKLYVTCTIETSDEATATLTITQLE